MNVVNIAINSNIMRILTTISIFLLLSILACDYSEKDKGACESSINPFGIIDTSLTLAAVGDMMFARAVQIHIDTAGYDAPLRDVAAHLSSFDITTGNLECPVSDLGLPMDKIYVFRANPKIIPELVHSGFDVLCVTNNHAFDYGLPCFLNSLERLREGGILPVGGGKNLSEALKPVYIDRNGLRVGIVAFNDTKTNYIGRDRPACAPARRQWVFETVRAARDSCDVLIAHVHWGLEYLLYPTDEQISLGRALIDSGATVVLGHHPHSWQGVEFYRDGLIAYSLGNFVFDQRDRLNNLSGILEIRFDGGKIERVEIRPVELMTHPKEPHFASGEFAGIFLGLLREACALFPTEIDTTGAKIILRPIE